MRPSTHPSQHMFAFKPIDEGLLETQPAALLAGAWLADAGRGMLRLLNDADGPRLRMHFVCADIYDVAAACGHRRRDGGGPLPRLFNKILMSNIADYTTMLPAFVHLLPLLAPAAPDGSVRRAGAMCF
jgi:hypothetical protein